MTDAERKLWQRLRAHRFCNAGFRRQALIGPYIVDFVCQEARLVIELDGGQHARSDQRVSDNQRKEWLEARGYTVMRFWNTDIILNLEGVLEQIAEVLEVAPPSRSAGNRRTDLPLKGGGVSEVGR